MSNPIIQRRYEISQEVNCCHSSEELKLIVERAKHHQELSMPAFYLYKVGVEIKRAWKPDFEALVKAFQRIK